jgi:hypothetical protein
MMPSIVLDYATNQRGQSSTAQTLWIGGMDHLPLTGSAQIYHLPGMTIAQTMPGIVLPSYLHKQGHVLPYQFQFSCSGPSFVTSRPKLIQPLDMACASMSWAKTMTSSLANFVDG